MPQALGDWPRGVRGPICRPRAAFEPCDLRGRLVDATLPPSAFRAREAPVTLRALPTEVPMPRTTRRHSLAMILTTSVVAGLAACGGGATTAGAPAGTPAPATATATAPAAATATATARVARPPRGSSSLITSAEIEAAAPDILNAYQLVERLRPMMMRPRNLSAGSVGDGNVFGVVAYVEEVRLGDVESLGTVMRATVREIRYIGATDATTRWGTGHSNGVIQVVLKR